MREESIDARRSSFRLEGLMPSSLGDFLALPTYRIESGEVDSVLASSWGSRVVQGSAPCD
jgi:hypothetical protein